MHRAGGWVLGAVVVLAMAVGGWIAFRPIFRRDVVRILFLEHPAARPPSIDAMFSGAQFALDQAGSKAGGRRLELHGPGSAGSLNFQLSLTVDEDGVLLVTVEPSPDRTIRLRLFPGLDGQGEAAARWAKNEQAKQIFVLDDENTTSSLAIRDAFLRHARVLGLSVVATVSTKVEREALLRSILEARPDLVFYAGEAAPYGTAFDVFDALRKRGYAGRLAMGDADPEVSFLAVSNRVVEGTFLISPIGPPSKEFAAAYEPATGRRAGPHAWPAFLTMQAVLDVIDRAASGRPEDLARALADRPPPQRPCALYEMKAGKFEFVRDLK